ncbi:LLM class flavin-dependent oxidoreductase [Halarcobacter ebronensis]|uniref:LLM class flavin-dependent oxidoreductase n=1 Tax=Halarcobacter ebronensis TaxID=1462615 RepID=A0A4Q1AYJ6_9BACT|nr:LLM class flavin-dependent oxidoreductase [Halarcobacter ebronensis]QKF82766.1 luciferase-like monooxygenase [Halarcobacter ebronensis]RXK06791.1 LLM class flavin-dependent oxidoreductase [Halarcobacter ebronensis]
MNIGLMLLYENWDNNYSNAFQQQQELILLGEELGLDEVWITEHHFNKFSLSSSILTLMAYIIATTKKIRVGTASILTPIYSPIIVAEAIATLNVLSNNRFNFGVAKGGPFKKQNELLDFENSRERMLHSLDEIFSYLKEESSVFPKPISNIPTFIASKDEQSITYAAQNNIGLMAAHLWSTEIIKTMIEQYKKANYRNLPPQIMCSRGFYMASSNEEAINEALPALIRFREQMEKQGISSPIFYDENYWIENGIIGDKETCIKKIKELKDLGITNLALKPISNDVEKNKTSLEKFAKEILPSF